MTIERLSRITKGMFTGGILGNSSPWPAIPIIFCTAAHIPGKECLVLYQCHALQQGDLFIEQKYLHGSNQEWYKLMSHHKQAQRLVKFLHSSLCQGRKVVHSHHPWHKQIYTAVSAVCWEQLFLLSSRWQLVFVYWFSGKYFCSLRMRHWECWLWSNCLCVKLESKCCLPSLGQQSHLE